MTARTLIAIVIPCYRVRAHIREVLAGIGDEVAAIYCIDDACPDGSGDYIEEISRDPRIKILRHEHNQGVGGAVMTGYRQAIQDGMGVLVKIDGDGQMDPSLVPLFAGPILNGEADYTKGNRFWDLTAVRAMPIMRRIGNLSLSFMTKASSGYWDLFDPTNGYTAIHAKVAQHLPFDSISRRYFFETDLLFRLNTLRAVVVDIPMAARYGDEVSHLKISRIVGEFAAKHSRNALKRIAYNYFLRDFSLASLELACAMALIAFGLSFGGYHWWESHQAHQPTPTGTIMISTVCLISGMQLLLAFLAYDIANVPRRALHRLLAKRAF